MEERGRALPDSYSLEAEERNVGVAETPSASAATRPLSPSDVTFRHSGWLPQRDRIRAALVRQSVPDGRLASWDTCGCDAWVMRDPENHSRLKICSSTCHDRFCIPCADSRSAKIGRRLRERVGADRISFLTLTLADNDVGLSGLIDKLLGSFRKLRTDKIWKRDVDGGVAFLEIKWNAKSSRWHPHLHVIMACGYLPQTWLSATWLRVTGTSFIVDIRRPTDAENVIRYITKYGSKPLDHSFVNDDDRLDEALEALHGRHLAIVFGDWRDWCLTDDDEHEQWEPIDTLSRLIARASSGDVEALSIMERLQCTILKVTTSEQQNKSPPGTVPF